jgi:glycosyltransferase involved in cell wall biosynthesis
MNILQLCNKVPYPPKDGGSLATWSLSTGMLSHGVSLEIISMQTSKHMQEDVELPDNLSGITGFKIVHLNTLVRFRKLINNLLFSKLPYNLTRFYSEDFSNKIIQSLTNQSFDIILLEGLSLSFYIPVIRKHSSSRIVMRAHNIEYLIWEGLRKKSKNILHKIYLNILMSRIKNFEIQQLNQYDGIVPITKNDADQILKLGYKGPLHVVPFGLKMDDYKTPESDSLPNDLIYIGALDWNPNIEGLKWFINQVWPHLHIRYPALKLNIAGRNPDIKLTGFFNTPGIQYFGEVEDVATFMEKGKIMIIPLFSGSGMRVKIIEGLARKKCIITTSKGMEGIPAENEKHLLKADSVQNYIDQIKKVLDHPEVCETLSWEGFQFVKQNFDNFVLTKGLIHFFKTLAS